MEKPTPVEPGNPSISRRVTARFISSIEFIKNQSTVDLNPHEGKLRSSAMPPRYMNIPDHVPEDFLPDDVD